VRAGARPRGLPAPPSAGPTVAVLSFANITGSGEDDWLGTGIAETVTADLKALPGLTVLGRERVTEALRKLGADAASAGEALAARVGREVGATFVLSGGFQRAGEAVRITARLTEVGTETIVHTVKIDGRFAQIFDLQDRVVRELAGALRPGRDEAAQAPDETHVLAAYEAFSKGVLNVRVESYEALDRAVFFFERAASLDPGYARAHLELASAWSTKAQYLGIPELHGRALASFRRALELRPGLVRAWREMGSVLVSLGRVDEGVESIRRGLEIDAQDAGALGSMGRALFVGRARFDEAAAFFERALERNPQGGWWALQLAHCRALLRDFERGEAAARRAVALQEELLSGQEGIVIVGAYMRQGHLAALQERWAEALERFERELAFLQRVDHALRSRIQIELHLRLGSACLGLGQAERARAAFALAQRAFEQRLRLGADDPFTRYYAACVHARCGEAGAALDSLEKAARDAGPFTIERARLEPELASLRDEPRFRALLGSPGTV
jgi:TolB-like protein